MEERHLAKDYPEYLESSEALSSRQMSPRTDRPLITTRKTFKSEEDEIPEEVDGPLDSPRPFLQNGRKHDGQETFRIELQQTSNEYEDLFIKRKPAEEVNLEELMPKRTYTDALPGNEGFEEFKPLINPDRDLSPPSTKDRSSTRSRQEIIRDKKRRIEEASELIRRSSVESYAEAFNEEAERAAVVLAEVPVEELTREQSEIEAANKCKKEQSLRKYQNQVKEMHSLLAESQDQLCHRQELMKKKIARNEETSIKETTKRSHLIKGAFSEASTTLHSYLDDSKRQVSQIYKDLSMDYKDARHNLAGKTKAADPNAWRHQEQLIEVHIACLRSVKDKLPKGRYAILCSVIDRLGGKVVEVKRKKSKKWRRVTSPKPHSGEYHLNNLVFNQPVLMFVPSRAKVQPSMAILFELFLLKSRDYAHDQVLGWGAFPLIGADFELNKGKFKIPMLFGPVDTSIVKYQDIENTYTEDIDTWVSNMYFEITRKDTLANPYTVQLVLDDETKKRYDKNLESIEDDTATTTNVKPQESRAIKEEGNAEKVTENPEDVLADRKRDLIEDILKTESDKEDETKVENSINKLDTTKGKIKKPEDYLQFTYHIPRSVEQSVTASDKILYVVNEAVSDLGFGNVMSIDFLMSFLILFIAAWIRGYLHTFGAWIFLKMAGVAINTFTPMLYSFMFTHLDMASDWIMHQLQ